MNNTSIKCSFASSATPVDERDLACRLFREKIGNLSRTDLVSVAIDKPSSAAARASAYTFDGQEVLTLEFDVMDDVMGEPQWRRFAEVFALQLAGK